ncbi:MAG: lipopolysaccharide biosynthesis protein, partial [Candidatus Zixiibacteriota bacterium]
MVVYGLGGFLTRAVGFLLLPFYTYYILPEEYGVMALVDLTGYILGVFITVQLSSGFMKYYYDCKSEEDKNRLIASTYLLVLLTGIIVLGILEVYAPEVCSLIVGGTEHTLLFRLVFITIFLDSLYSIFQSYIRAKERPTLFVVLQVTKTLLSLILNVYFIAFLKLSILGIFLTNT